MNDNLPRTPIIGPAAWVAHFERNRRLNREIDAAINWRADTALPSETALAVGRSLQRFEIGERGDGEVLLRKARAGDPEYAKALELFVAEEQQHAHLLGRSLEHLGVPPLSTHWSNSVFVTARRMFTLRWEVMVLTVAEVIALSYYGALSQCGDPAVEAMSRRIVDDEHQHVAFQIDSLQRGFIRMPIGMRMLVRGIWMILAAGTTAVVLLDHGGALRVCGWTRARFARAAGRDFRRVSRDALLSRRKRSAPDPIPAVSGMPR
ncbi:ferritin-like domain-containing protein [Mycobacteroides sp. LB1]|uniref:ferritin-like domain-containing protein n=1 Tax=Mycobacteroides sp. LB1 TaxID=2750814 RepID=UPI0015DD62F7|nr:ferritin-like domain-containing protein [Mycobacteroides sp. LB1]